MDDEQCPKCGAMFPAERAWAKRSLTMLLFAPTLQELGARVRCPACGTEFPATEFRFFGFVSPRAMRIALGLFVAILVVAGTYFLFVEDV